MGVQLLPRNNGMVVWDRGLLPPPMGWRQSSGRFGDFFSGGDASAPQSSSLFTPSASALSIASSRGRQAHQARARIAVDFRNMPRGVRTETQADSDTDLEVRTGYAMQGAQ